MKYIVLLLLIGVGVFFFTHKSSAAEEIDYAALQKLLKREQEIILLDVRTKEEFDSGHIPGAILLPYDEVEKRAAEVLPDKERTIVLYCRSGRRSAIAAGTLKKLGYNKLYDFGAVSKWRGELVR